MKLFLQYRTEFDFISIPKRMSKQFFMEILPRLHRINEVTIQHRLGPRYLPYKLTVDAMEHPDSLVNSTYHFHYEDLSSSVYDFYRVHNKIDFTGKVIPVNTRFFEVFGHKPYGG